MFHIHKNYDFKIIIKYQCVVSKWSRNYYIDAYLYNLSLDIITEIYIFNKNYCFYQNRHQIEKHDLKSWN